MEKQTFTAFGITKLRKQYGLKQGELAQKLGITQSSLSRYEHGDTIPKYVQNLLNFYRILRDLGKVD